MPPKRPSSPSQATTEEGVGFAQMRARIEGLRSAISSGKTGYRSEVGCDSIPPTTLSIEAQRPLNIWETVETGSLLSHERASQVPSNYAPLSIEARTIERNGASKIPDGVLETPVDEPDGLGEVWLNVMGPGDFSATPGPVTEGEKIMLLSIRIATVKPNKGEIGNETAEAWKSALNSKYKSDIVSGLAKVAEHLRTDVRSAALNKVIEWADQKGIRGELQFCS